MKWQSDINLKLSRESAMGMWIELGVFFLVLLFAVHQMLDLKKEKRKREQKKEQQEQQEQQK
jgi:hypothetical protein